MVAQSRLISGQHIVCSSNAGKNHEIRPKQQTPSQDTLPGRHYLSDNIRTKQSTTIPCKHATAHNTTPNPTNHTAPTHQQTHAYGTTPLAHPQCLRPLVQTTPSSTYTSAGTHLGCHNSRQPSQCNMYAQSSDQLLHQYLLHSKQGIHQ